MSQTQTHSMEVPKYSPLPCINQSFGTGYKATFHYDGTRNANVDIGFARLNEKSSKRNEKRACEIKWKIHGRQGYRMISKLVTLHHWRTGGIFAGLAFMVSNSTRVSHFLSSVSWSGFVHIIHGLLQEMTS